MERVVRLLASAFAQRVSVADVHRDACAQIRKREVGLTVTPERSTKK